MAAFRLTSGGAGCRNCRIDEHVVTKGRNNPAIFFNFLHCSSVREILAAKCTGVVLRIAWLCAGCLLRISLLEIVSANHNRNGFRLGCVTTITGIGHLAFRRCGRLDCYNAFVPIVTEGGNILLCHRIVATRAMATFRLTGCGAGCRYCRINDHVVTEGGNILLCHRIVATRAMATLCLTGCRTGRRYCRVSDHVMTEGRNILLCNGIVAARAVAAFRLTGGCTGRCYCRIDDHVVTESGDSLLCNCVVAARAMAAFCLAGCRTGWCYRYVGDHVVTKCRKNPAIFCDFFRCLGISKIQSAQCACVVCRIARVCTGCCFCISFCRGMRTGFFNNIDLNAQIIGRIGKLFTMFITDHHDLYIDVICTYRCIRLNRYAISKENILLKLIVISQINSGGRRKGLS